MLEITLTELAAFPERLERNFRAIPRTHWSWVPPTWETIPSERFTALEQVCHVRDIEVDGYLERLRLLLETDSPRLASIDSYELCRQRRYHEDDPEAAFVVLRSARAQLLGRVRGLSEDELSRGGEFEGYGAVTVRGLVHYLSMHDQLHLAGLQWLLAQIDTERCCRTTAGS